MELDQHTLLNNLRSKPRYRRMQADLIPVQVLPSSSVLDPSDDNNSRSYNEETSFSNPENSVSVPVSGSQFTVLNDSSYERTAPSLQSSPSLSVGLFTPSPNSHTDLLITPDTPRWSPSFSFVQLGTDTTQDEQVVTKRIHALSKDTIDMKQNSFEETNIIELWIGDKGYHIDKELWLIDRDPRLAKTLDATILSIQLDVVTQEYIAQNIEQLLSNLYHSSVINGDTSKTEIKKVIRQGINVSTPGTYDWWSKFATLLQSHTLLTILDEEYTIRFLRLLCRHYYEEEDMELPSIIDESVNFQDQHENTLLESLEMARYYKFERMEKVIVQSLSFHSTKSAQNTNTSLFVASKRKRPGGAII